MKEKRNVNTKPPEEFKQLHQRAAELEQVDYEHISAKQVSQKCK